MKRFILLLLVTILFFGSIPTNSLKASANSSVTITIDSLNVREGPGLSYRVVKKVNRGESFKLVKEENDWIQIELSNNQFGWVANWLVKKNATQGYYNNQTMDSSGVVTVDGLRVRNGPGLSFQTIGHLGKGAKVQVLEKNENWVKINFSDFDGWVSSDFVSIFKGQASEQQTVTESSKDFNATVTVDSLNVRSEASLVSSILGKLKKGDKIEVISLKNEWVQFLFLGQKAWIHSDFVDIHSPITSETSSEEENSQTKTGMIGTVTANALNVRNKADLSGKIVGTVSKGDNFTILEEVNNWSKIEFSPNQYGWVSNWYLDKSVPKNTPSVSQEIKESIVTILHNGTNIRSGPSVSNSVVLRANEGDQFPIKSLNGEWYEIKLDNEESAYIAGWIVAVNGSAPQVEKLGADAHIKNKTIVLDPGHGGGDNGTTGARGTLEKELTLKTANLLYDKLRASGANVVLTRTNDSYLSLRSRVSTAHYHQADAFISIHYDSILDRSVRGMTTYYYHSFQKPMAEAVHSSTISKTKLKDRGARFGDYHVIRENHQKAILLELGYLSNPTEETMVTSPQYQETVATGIYNGLARFFKAN